MSEPFPVGSARAAFMFLTRVPLGRRWIVDSSAMAGAPAWFAAIGALIGLAVGGVYAGLFDLVGPGVAAASAIGIGALITGAFHHDGLADTADGFGGGWTVARRLEIMRDSRIGTYGTMSLIVAAALQVTALASHGPAAGFAMVVIAHATARAGAVVLLTTMQNVRPEGLGAQAAPGSQVPGSRRHAVVGVVFAMVVGALLVGWLVVFAIGAVALGVGSVAWLAHRKIGGVTGDVLGAAEQIAETLVLVVGAGLIRHIHHWPWWT